jgi:hypothetical protein
VSERSVLQGVGSAKLLPPAVAPPAFVRERLEERLDDVFGRRLALVVAGAGFGKTTLLSGWSARLRVAWYTLASEDVELGVLVRGLVGLFACGSRVSRPRDDPTTVGRHGREAAARPLRPQPRLSPPEPK